MPTPSTILCARMKLARELDVKPNELEYIGKMMGPDYKLLMFIVHKFGDRLHLNIRSVKVRYDG